MVGPSSILVADDETSSLCSTAALLRGDGYDCDAVPDARQAIQRLRGKRYDLLIAEIEMPGNRNLEFAKQTHRLAPETPIVLTTRHPSVDTAISAIQLPVVAYLKKPVPYRELLPHVEGAPQRSKSFRATCEVHELLQTCIKEVERFKHQRLPAEKTAERTPAGVPNITARILAYCAFQLVITETTPDFRENQPTFCQQMQCPQWPIFRDALRKSVDVLKETKNRFKSKELANLRDELEALLKESEKFPHSP